MQSCILPSSIVDDSFKYWVTVKRSVTVSASNAASLGIAILKVSGRFGLHSNLCHALGCSFTARAFSFSLC